MPASLATVTSLLKEVYQGRLRNQLNSEVVGFKRIERTSEGTTSEVGGKYVTFPLKVRRNQGIGYRNELELLPNPGQAGYASVRVGLKYGYGRLRLSRQMMRLARDNARAFANAMQEEIIGLKDDVLKDVSRIFYQDGTGRMATAAAAGAAVNTVTVDSTQYLEVGQVIDIVTAATSTVKAAARTITAINLATKVVTFDGAAATFALGDILVRTGNVNREPNGLNSIVTATGTLFNVDPSVEPVWKATVDSNAGTLRALSEGAMISSVHAARTQGGKTSVILTSLGVMRAYFNLLQSQRRFTDTKEFAGGYRGLAFAAGTDGDIPVVPDVDAPPNTLWGLDEKSFKIYHDEDWSFLDEDGNMWKWVHDYDAYECVLAKYWELAVNKRNANWVMKDYTEA